MKNYMIVLLSILLIIVAMPAEAPAQTNMTFTTTSAALTPGATTMRVASATGFTANTTMAIIGDEAVNVVGVSGTTITITRGYNGTTARGHRSGDIVLVGPYNYFYSNSPNTGSCTATSQTVLPYVSIDRGTNRVRMWNCNNGFWEEQIIPNATTDWRNRYCNADISGFSLLTSFTDSNSLTFGTNTTPVSGTVLYGTIFVPRTMSITGLSVLNGTVAGTDSVIYSLYDAGGRLIANTALAGTTASGTNRFQDVAFTSTKLVTGPALYWGGWSANGTTTRVRTIPAPISAAATAFTGLLGSSFTATFGTLTNLTADAADGNPATTSLPTSLIANTAPIMCIY